MRRFVRVCACRDRTPRVAVAGLRSARSRAAPANQARRAACCSWGTPTPRSTTCRRCSPTSPPGRTFGDYSRQRAEPNRCSWRPGLAATGGRRSGSRPTPTCRRDRCRPHQGRRHDARRRRAAARRGPARRRTPGCPRSGSRTARIPRSPERIRRPASLRQVFDRSPVGLSYHAGHPRGGGGAPGRRLGGRALSRGGCAFTRGLGAR